MNKTVIIIGAGLGGLFTGALLSKEGYKVTVLEKNTIIGGGLQTFRRFGEEFDTGMHVLGGLQPGGNVYRICKYLNIIDKLNIRDVDYNCTDYLYFAEDKTAYCLCKGKNGFIESLARYFPDDRDSLINYVNAIFSLTEQVDLFNLRPSQGYISMFNSCEEYLLAANEFISKYIKNKKLASILAYINPLYGGRKNHTPAYVHAIISVLFINGTTRFVGGSIRFADLLKQAIIQGGGSVISNDEVVWVEVNNRRVDYVRTKNDIIYSGDYYISAIHPCSLFRLLPDSALPKIYIDRLNGLPNTYSAFSVFIKLKEKTFPYINHTEYYMSHYDDVWDFGSPSNNWPLGFLFMTPPVDNQDQYTSKAIITAPMSFDEVRKWEKTKSGHRGDGYKKWKQQKTEVILDLVEEMHPRFRSCIDKIITASPLTIRDFYGVKEGSMYGFSKDCNDIAASQVPVVTKIKNLYLTGQNNNLHGFCGVPLTAINTCEAILGLNVLINKINSCG